MALKMNLNLKLDRVGDLIALGLYWMVIKMGVDVLILEVILIFIRPDLYWTLINIIID